mmetsp:Transcript_47655/g.116850  ORF Transcript_47655/g.116850 Transcript_47655/m.116850 type:complete len:263 (-) Transcript_47655:92-880(-)
MHPFTLVRGVVDAPSLPFAFVVRIVLHRRLPLPVLLIIPIVRLLGVLVHNPFLLNPIVRLLVLGIVDLLFIHPIIGLLFVGVVDLLRGQEIPIVLKVALAFGLAVKEHLVRVVRLYNQSKQVRKLVRLPRKVGLAQQILALVREDQMRSLSRVTTLIRPKHDVVRRRVTEFLLIIRLGTNLDVAASALNILFMLHLVLDHKRLAFIAKGLEDGRGCEMPGIILRFKALVDCGIVVVLPSAKGKGALGTCVLLPLTVHPAVPP